MKNIRRNSITGIIESQGLTEVSLHFSEWWNGEGMDFNFDDKKFVSLHLEELHAMMVGAVACGMIDIGSVMKEATELEIDSKRREQELERMRSNYNV